MARTQLCCISSVAYPYLEGSLATALAENGGSVRRRRVRGGSYETKETSQVWVIFLDGPDRNLRAIHIEFPTRS